MLPLKTKLNFNIVMREPRAKVSNPGAINSAPRCTRSLVNSWMSYSVVEKQVEEVFYLFQNLDVRITEAKKYFLSNNHACKNLFFMYFYIEEEPQSRF
jgi:uncharacterized protein YcgI (DUF1989 family)